MLNFGLLGCGKISVRHSNLLGHGEIQGAKLSAVCDKNLESAKKIGEKFNVPFFSDISEMMNSCKLDVVVVLTPSGMHAKNTIELSKYGCDILVEKPMALTLDDADQMINACNEANVRLFIVKQNRFNPAIQELKKAIHQKRFGKIFLATIRVLLQLSRINSKGPKIN